MAAASIAGMAVTSGLAIFALDARDAARDERREAEGLVEFMLGDLKGKLEPIGKLDALDGVGARILAYYSKQDAAELDDAGLMQRSRALSLTAQVAFQRADLATAERLYQQALTGTAEAIRRDPSDAERLFDHAQNVFWVGELARHRGQIGKAEAATFEYQRLANRMVAIEPANLRYRIETVYATENVAIVLLNRRQFGEARRLIEAALGTINAMATANPDNEEYQRELGTILAWLADANRDDGRLAEATAARRRQIDLLSGKLASGEPNVRFQEQLLWGRRALGILLVMQGEMQRAITELKLAVQQADQLIQVEPDNGQWRGHAAGARLELATALIMLGRASEANRETTTGCELTSAIRERDPQGSWWLENQTNCRLNRARLAMMDGALEDSLALAASAVDSARIERGTDAAKTRYRIAGAYRLVGDIHQRSGNREAARAAWAEGLQQLPTNVRERPREMAERAGLLDRLGRDKEARPLVRKLKDIGFKAQY